MKTLLLKEVRLLLPFWLAALLLAAAGPWLHQPLLWFGMGIVLLAVTPFGMEFSHGTFALLLVQPVPRRRIWRVKLFTLTLAVGSVLSVFYLSFWCRLKGAVYAGDSISAAAFSLVLVLVIVAGGLWTTLLLRQIAAAIWLTALVPAFLVLVLDVLTDTFQKKGSFVPSVVVLIVYAVLGMVGARWLFHHAQDAQWTGGTVSLSLHRFWPAWTREGEQTRPRSDWLALLIKELHLHQTGLLLAGGAAVFHVVVILVGALVGRPVSAHTYETLEYLDLTVWFLWFVVAAMLGAMAVAEERKLGTLEGQLCLPATRRTQFVFKFAVVLILSAVFAGLLPWALDKFRIWTGVHGEFGMPKVAWKALLELTTAVSVTTAVSFFASTVARNTLQALGVAVVLGVIGIFVAEMAAHPRFRLGFALWDGPLINYIAWPVMVTTAFGLAYANFKRLHEGNRAVVRNLLVLIGALLGVTTVTAFTYNRAWEFVMLLEPGHGPARISRSGRTKLGVVPGRDKWLVLLPDGRLWASRDYLTGEMVGFKHWQHRPPRSNSGFLPGSDWVNVATSLQETLAIKTDGSLWTLFRYQRGQAAELKLSRLDSATNWVDLVAGTHHFLGIKQDGTLWGWGDNSQAQLAANLPKTNQTPVRIGSDADWVTCFTSWGTSVGVKRDGSVWRWGGWEVSQNHVWSLVPPIKLNLDGTGLKAIGRGSDGGWIGLYEDGNLWYSSPVRLGTNSIARPPSDPCRFGAAADWLEMSCNDSAFVGLKRDGSFWKARASMNSVRAWSYDLSHAIRASKYSDWIAVSAAWGNRMTLAADGTLCAWPQGYRNDDDLLRPSRRCPGSVNLFDTPTTLTPAKP